MAKIIEKRGRFEIIEMSEAVSRVHDSSFITNLFNNLPRDKKEVLKNSNKNGTLTNEEVDEFFKFVDQYESGSVVKPVRAFYAVTPETMWKNFCEKYGAKIAEEQEAKRKAQNLKEEIKWEEFREHVQQLEESNIDDQSEVDIVGQGIATYSFTF